MRARIATALAMTMAMTTLLAGCNTPGPVNAPVAHRQTSFKYGTGDGQTMTTAVEIRSRSATEGDALVLDWIRAKYPGFTIQGRQLVEQRGHAYDLVTIIGPLNASHLLYFDISSYYRPF